MLSSSQPQGWLARALGVGGQFIRAGGKALCVLRAREAPLCLRNYPCDAAAAALQRGLGGGLCSMVSTQTRSGTHASPLQAITAKPQM